MKTRRFLAALLAATCATSLAVPTFATAPDAKPLQGSSASEDADALANWTMTVSTTLQSASLKVTLPNTSSVIINPYRMGIVVDDSDVDNVVKTYDTVLTPEMEVKNESECAIMVGVKGQVTTYQKVAADVFADYKPISDSDATVTKITLKDPTGTDVVIDGFEDVKVDDPAKPKVFTDNNGYILTAKYTATTKNTDGSVKKAGTFAVTGYTASKDVKVATATLGAKVDTDTTNTIFAYAQGRLEDAEYADVAKTAAATASAPAGALVLTGNKDAEGKVLYLGGDETGFVKISGDVTTAPKTAWDNYKGLVSVPFIFQIQAVANKKPVDPNVTGFTFTTSKGSAADAAVTANAATTTWTSDNVAIYVNEDSTIKISATEATGAKVSYALDTASASLASIDGDTITLGSTYDASVAPALTVEVTAENIGKPAVTYTLTINFAKKTA